jgi:hypothetical protein
MERVEWTMPDVNHCFRRGHKIMVQVQSSWFPLVDRNPQQFLDIYNAKTADFIKATQRVYRSRRRALGRASVCTEQMMSVYNERRDDLERHEFMMGMERGRLAVTLDMLTDALVLVGQHGVYCQSARQPGKPAMDVQIITKLLEDSKELVTSVMDEIPRRISGAGRPTLPPEVGRTWLVSCRNGFLSFSRPTVVLGPCPAITTASSGSVISFE